MACGGAGSLGGTARGCPGTCAHTEAEALQTLSAAHAAVSWRPPASPPQRPASRSPADTIPGFCRQERAASALATSEQLPSHLPLSVSLFVQSLSSNRCHPSLIKHKMIINISFW